MMTGATRSTFIAFTVFLLTLCFFFGDTSVSAQVVPPPVAWTGIDDGSQSNGTQTVEFPVWQEVV